MTPFFSTSIEPQTTDHVIHTRVSYSELMNDRSDTVLRIIVDKVASEVAAEIVKNHKKNLVRLVLRNPDLFRSVASVAMSEVKGFFSRTTDEEPQ